MKTMLLSNVNMRPLVAFLRPWETTCGEFNSILLDLSDPASPAGSSEFGQILCLCDTDAMMGGALYGQGEPEQCEAFLNALESFSNKHSGKLVIANTFYLRAARWLNFADLLHPLSLRATEARLNERLIAIARANPNLLLLDTELLFRRYGENALLSDAFWYFGRIRYTNQMFRSMATMVRQAVDAYANRAKKVLILDLDNTLWGGILGEAGPLGIALSEDGAGRCYRDFQRAIKAVQRSGVLLGICSKNDPAEVDDVFDRNSMMVLNREDFACIRANWEPKPDNILNIADTLNLGVDSFLFIDDSPVEREFVRTAMPDVVVPEFPASIENLVAWFLGDVVPAWLGKYELTAEDQNKTAQYRVSEERRKLFSSLDLDGFLRDLRIETVFLLDPKEHLSRIAQLTQKTNQFNLTTRRYRIPEINRFLDSSDYGVVVLDYKDRFGAEGIVGLAILNYAEQRIDTLLMSCRIIGRKVEDRILSKVCDLFEARDCPRISAEFIPTGKNQQVAAFYDTHGFTLLSEDPDGRKLYERIVA
jgi:FkbH-like protein